MDHFIKDNSIDIATMADKSGFKSLTTFNTSFTRYTGMTPGEWCKKFKNVAKNEMVKKDKRERKTAR